MLFERSPLVKSLHLPNRIMNTLNPVVQPEWCFVFPYLFSSVALLCEVRRWSDGLTLEKCRFYRGWKFLVLIRSRPWTPWKSLSILHQVSDWGQSEVSCPVWHCLNHRSAGKVLRLQVWKFLVLFGSRPWTPRKTLCLYCPSSVWLRADWSFLSRLTLFKSRPDWNKCNRAAYRKVTCPIWHRLN